MSTKIIFFVDENHPPKSNENVTLHSQCPVMMQEAQNDYYPIFVSLLDHCKMGRPINFIPADAEESRQMRQRPTYNIYLGCSEKASYSCKKAVDNYLKAIENIANNEELKSCAHQTMTRNAPYGSFEEWTKEENVYDSFENNGTLDEGGYPMEKLIKLPTTEVILRMKKFSANCRGIIIASRIGKIIF